MSEHSLNSNYDSDYHISYDAIYNIPLKIPTKSDEFDKDGQSCLCEFYQHSKWFVAFFSITIATMIGIMYLVIYLAK